MKTIIIVSGVRRSGTALLMQMLEKGGVDCAYQNKSDHLNPRGYYDNLDAQNLKNSGDFLDKLDQKATKVIASKLKFLPKKHKYKILFIERNTLEVATSILSLSRKRKNQSYPSYPRGKIHKISEVIKNAKETISNNSNMEVLNLKYSEVLNEPQTEVRKIASFLNLELNTNEMISAVEPTLQSIHFSKLNPLISDRSPIEVSEVISWYTENKVFCEIGCAEGEILKRVLNAKSKIGIERIEAKYDISLRDCPDAHIYNSKFEDLVDTIDFDVVYIWIVYPAVKNLINLILNKNKDATIILGINYYYHLKPNDPKAQAYISFYPPIAKAENWNHLVDKHLEELVLEGHSAQIAQVNSSSTGETFSVAIINSNES